MQPVRCLCCIMYGLGLCVCLCVFVCVCDLQQWKPSVPIRLVKDSATPELCVSVCVCVVCAVFCGSLCVHGTLLFNLFSCSRVVCPSRRICAAFCECMWMWLCVCVQRNKLFYFGWLCPLIGVHLIFCVLAYVFCMSVLPTNKLLDK